MSSSSGNILNSLLASRQMTKVQLAEKLGVSHSFIHHLLKGRKAISLVTLEKIEAALTLENHEYQNLLRALSEEAQGLQSLISKVEQKNLDEVLAPFALNCFSQLKAVKDVKVRRSQALNSDSWKGFVDLQSPSFRFDLRLFIGIPEPGKVGLHWKQSRSRISIPEAPLIEVSIALNAKDSRRFQEKIKYSPIQFLKPSASSQQRQSIHVTNP